MDVMRNSGFEMGSSDYWAIEGFASLNVTDANPAHGTYSAVLVTGAGFDHLIYNNDLISVNSGDKVHVGAYVAGLMDEYYALGIRTYDKSGVYIGTVYGSRYKGLANYRYVHDEVEVPVWASYISFVLKSYTPGTGKTIYVDLCSLQINSRVESSYRAIELMDESDLTASGDSKDYRKLISGYGSYYAEVECTSLTGTNPTLDVEICEIDQYANERVLGQFTQIVGLTDQRVGIAKPIGMGIYAKYTEGGTWTDCDFKVSVIGVR